MLSKNPFTEQAFLGSLPRARCLSRGVKELVNKTHRSLHCNGESKSMETINQINVKGTQMPGGKGKMVFLDEVVRGGFPKMRLG